MFEVALRYAELGYSVFPCVPGQKKPLTNHGLNDATTDREQIERWWLDHPTANVGIRTEGLVVIDVDGSGENWLGDQDARWEDVAAAPSSMTPRGGRHYLFRQPEGKNWRNTQGRLAPKVDTRANGGYIIAPPSLFEGRTYQWCEGHELEVSTDQLPEPPAWLIAQLDRLEARPTKHSEATRLADSIIEGQRNGTLTSLAGAMRRVGMSRDELAAALHRANRDRCVPPLDSVEVDRIAESIARYPPAEVWKALASGTSSTEPDTALRPPQSLRELMAAFPRLREPVIRELLRIGETMNVISLPKLGKSWLVVDLALSICSGRTWLGNFETEVGDVLILDNELHGETIAQRIPKVAAARGIPVETVEDSLYVKSLRGQLKTVLTLGPFFEGLEPGRFQVIVLDAFYRFMPRDMDENDNGTMASLYNHLDLYADRLGCCFVLIHHTTKGNQSAKSVTDVGAGAGSQSRATDTHLILRPHEEADVVVLEAAVRSWPPVPPRCLRWTFPVWTPAADLDPAQLKGERSKRKTESGPDIPPEVQVRDFVSRFVREEPQTRAAILRAATTAGHSGRQAQRLLRWAEDDGRIFRWGGGHYHPSLYAMVPKPGCKEKGDA